LDSSAPNPEAAAERKSLLFRVGTDVFACEIELVREIVRFARMTRIPGAPPFVRGLLNVRGEVLSVLDVGMRLMPDRAPREDGSIIVVQVGDRQAGLVVEEVIGVQAVASQGDEKQGDAKYDEEIVRPLGHLDDRIVLLLDVPTFVNQSLV
jgi:purine-binding chemotaxis protein CheW